MGCTVCLHIDLQRKHLLLSTLFSAQIQGEAGVARRHGTLREIFNYNISPNTNVIGLLKTILSHLVHDDDGGVKELCDKGGARRVLDTIPSRAI